YVAFVLTKSAVNMGMPNTENASMSALPLGFAYPTNENFPVMLDFCMAYASVGQLGEKKRNGKTIDAWWGVNEQGDQTNDPAELLKGTRFPIGLHKGYGMSMLGEVLTGVMSGGVIMDQKAQEHGLLTNTSQTIIAIKADAIVPMEKFKEQTSYISKRAKELGGEDLNIPGERSAKSEYKILEKGYIELTNELIEKLNSYADLFNIKKL
ncbi:MAG: Ldh family oxidoreductase, partial [Clostridia bacterium]